MKPAKLTAFAIAFLLPVVALAQPALPAPPIAGPAASAAPAAPIAPVAPPAIAGPVSFEILDRGDAVEVIAHNVRAARTAIQPIRSRLQVPLAGAPTAKRVLPGDATVKLIELDGDDTTRVLSVKLGFERADVKTLSRFAQVIQVGDDLHVLVPRKVPAGDVAPRLPDPTISPERARTVARTEASPAPIAKPEAPKPDVAKSDVAKPDVAKPAAANDAKATPRSEALPDATADVGVEPIAAAAPQPRSALARSGSTGSAATPAGNGKPWKTAASDGDDTWSKLSMYAAIGLAAAGAAAWLMRRRRTQVASPAVIEVIAQRSLGGKSRIVWLSAGPREMIVAVTAQQVRMLGQWRKADPRDTRAGLPAAHTHSHAGPDPRNAPIDDRSGIAAGAPAEFADGTGVLDRTAAAPVSPAVSGILRLRGRTGQMPAVAVSDEIATGDVVADELWAREILAATRVRR